MREERERERDNESTTITTALFGAAVFRIEVVHGAVRDIPHTMLCLTIPARTTPEAERTTSTLFGAIHLWNTPRDLNSELLCSNSHSPTKHTRYSTTHE